VTGLSVLTTYYMNVLVQDRAGNIAACTSASGTTTDFPRIFWVDSTPPEIASTTIAGPPFTVRRADLTSTGQTNPFAVAVDPVGMKVYWTHNKSGAYAIYRSNLDGQNVQNLGITGLNKPCGIAVDWVRGYLYWTDATNVKIYRSSLPPAAGAESVYMILDSANVHAPWGIDVDMTTGDFLWVESDTTHKQIRKAPCSNPTSIVDIVASLSSPVDLAVDSVNKMVYWTDNVASKVLAHNLTPGTTTYDVINQNLGLPSGITIDVPNGQVYWADITKNNVYRAPTSTRNGNADNFILGVTGTRGPQGLAIY
jgi:DNA-binding beta-propeller fold protein YncE